MFDSGEFGRLELYFFIDAHCDVLYWYCFTRWIMYLYEGNIFTSGVSTWWLLIRTICCYVILAERSNEMLHCLLLIQDWWSCWKILLWPGPAASGFLLFFWSNHEVEETDTISQKKKTLLKQLRGLHGCIIIYVSVIFVSKNIHVLDNNSKLTTHKLLSAACFL